MYISERTKKIPTSPIRKLAPMANAAEKARRKIYHLNIGQPDIATPDSFFDAAIGNVPFGQYQVSDRRYDKLHFQIHDYFLAKTVDKLRVGGIMAFITTSGTLDKKSEEVPANDQTPTNSP